MKFTLESSGRRNPFDERNRLSVFEIVKNQKANDESQFLEKIKRALEPIRIIKSVNPHIKIIQVPSMHAEITNDFVAVYYIKKQLIEAGLLVTKEEYKGYNEKLKMPALCVVTVYPIYPELQQPRFSWEE
jgi:hypothetical protein